MAETDKCECLSKETRRYIPSFQSVSNRYQIFPHIHPGSHHPTLSIRKLMRPQVLIYFLVFFYQCRRKIIYSLYDMLFDFPRDTTSIKNLVENHEIQIDTSEYQ